MPVIPRLGYLSQVREPLTGWVTLSSLGNITQDGSFYPGWATLPRLGKVTQPVRFPNLVKVTHPGYYRHYLEIALKLHSFVTILKLANSRIFG